MDILAYIQANLTDWLCIALSGMLGYIIRKMRQEKRKNDAVAEGMKSLLRESIVNNYNKYQDREYCPIYAKESIKRVYKAYHDLDGNDVATKLYNTLLEMQEEPKEER